MSVTFRTASDINLEDAKYGHLCAGKMSCFFYTPFRPTISGIDACSSANITLETRQVDTTCWL